MCGVPCDDSYWVLLPSYAAERRGNPRINLGCKKLPCDRNNRVPRFWQGLYLRAGSMRVCAAGSKRAWLPPAAHAHLCRAHSCQGLTALAAVSVSIVNLILKMAIEQLAEFERHHSVSGETAASASWPHCARDRGSAAGW